jgi:hypothetical protein
MLIGFVAVDPESSVVPMSLQVSMVAEGFHGNRGLVPLSPRVRLRSSPALPAADAQSAVGR